MLENEQFSLDLWKIDEDIIFGREGVGNWGKRFEFSFLKEFNNFTNLFVYILQH